MTTITERLAKFERRQSGPAVWCQKLAVFALPYLVIVILGHRSGTFETVPTFWLLALGLAILVGSLILGLKGFHDLWTSGKRGGLASARGMALSGILLVPFLFLGAKAFVLPPIYDISTDLDWPPEFDNALDDRVANMNEIKEPTEATKQLQLRAYPKVVARRYPLGAGRVFKAIAEQVRERDWVILTADAPTGNAPVDEEGSGLVATPVVDANGRPLNIPLPKFRSQISIPPQALAAGEAQSVSPIGRGVTEPPAPIAEGVETETPDERYVEAVASSFLFGFESDVVIRVVEEEEGTLVDMRSNSRWGPHDLGSNAARIISFMSDLDTALQGLSQ